MSLRNYSSTEGVFDSVFNRASHIIPSRVPHGVVVCIDQPMRTCSLRQSGILAPTPASESTASFTDEMGGTMDRLRIGRNHQTVLCHRAQDICKLKLSSVLIDVHHRLSSITR